MSQRNQANVSPVPGPSTELEGVRAELFRLRSRLLEQSEELQRMRAELDCEQARYRDLFESVTPDSPAPAAKGSGQSFLRMVLDTTPAMIFVKDWEGRFVLANQALAACYGTTPDGVVGKTDADFNAHPDEVAHFRRDDQEVILTRRAKLIGEERVTYADGTVHWLSTVKVPLIEADGSCSRMLGVASDITERKQAELALRESQRQLQLATEAGQVGVWAWLVPENRIITTPITNRLLGFPESWAPTPEAVQARLHPADRERVCRLMQEAAARGGDYRLEARVIHPGGREHWVSVIGSLARGPSGEPECITGVMLDITESKRLEAERSQLMDAERCARAELERQLRLKDEFLSTLSHELRTPLTGIIGWTQLLRRGRMGPAESGQALETIETSAWAQKQLIDDLLDMGRIISGKLRLALESLEIGRVIREALATAGPVARARGVQLVERIEPELGPVLGDANRLQQVFWNLLSNAVKFTDRGGRVVVDAQRCDGRIRVSVADTGIGIAPEFLPHVFERFRQADGSVTRRHHGLGLGLAIVKQLCDLHGAAVRVESAGTGAGATFTVELPIFEAPAPEPEMAEIGAAAGPAVPITCNAAKLRGWRVLLVEDDPAARDLVARILRECELEVHTADSAASALAAMEEAPPDVLISDISMPDEDGYALIARVRAHPRQHLSAVPAIALTALARPEDRSRALRAGYQEHVAKPVNTGQLLTAIAAAARLARGSSAAGRPVH